MKLRRCILLFVLSFLVVPFVVKANTINEIDMDIYVSKDGTAHVTETWDANLTSGTEGYKPYYNLGKASITNFKVSESGKTYKLEKHWNPDLSFDIKAYRYGINSVRNGVELCWGISKYGRHTYVLTYDIKGFVVKLNDSDMIYWNLIPDELSSKPRDVHIKLRTDNYLSSEVPVWGYGNDGTAYVYDGYIEMNSEGILNSDEYMTLLVKFDKDTFDSYHKIDTNFDYYHNMAEEGAIHHKKSDNSLSNTILSLFKGIFFLIIFIFIISKKDKNKNNVGSRKYEYGTKGKKIPKDVPNYRDIPFGTNIFKAYFVANLYNLNKNKTDLLGAIILKWLKEKKIAISKTTTRGLFGSKEEIVLVLNNENFSSSNELETRLHTMMYVASEDGILEAKEFERWCEKNYNKILNWFDRVIDSESDRLCLEGLIKVQESKNVGIFKNKKYIVCDKAYEDACKLKGFKNFLEEFSRMNDKEAIEVNMWEYYLIYAQILGIADKVAAQFKKLYPELIENPQYGYSYSDIIFINHVSNHGLQVARTSKQRAENYSAGGGGFSSSGGGRGSFGGGSGGGGFR